MLRLRTADLLKQSAYQALTRATWCMGLILFARGPKRTITREGLGLG